MRVAEPPVSSPLPRSAGPSWPPSGTPGVRAYTPEALNTNRRALGCLLEIAETLLLTLVIFWVIQTFIAQPYRVEQESMRATLEQNQYVLVDKLTPHFDNYSRGDIIVFNPVVRDGSCDSPGVNETGEDGVPFIKRVIGEPGDTVSIHDGSVFINGVALDEPYVFQGPTSANGVQDTWHIAADRLFVMGDNRNNSTDSRSPTIGPICIRDVIGKAWLRYWPLDALGILSVPTYADVPTPAPSNGAALSPASSAP
jgi:signal peptidase I